MYVECAMTANEPQIWITGYLVVSRKMIAMNILRRMMIISQYQQCPLYLRSIHPNSDWNTGSPIDRGSARLRFR